jgi:organic hydroperoxide reductase OsmC/OhrA
MAEPKAKVFEYTVAVDGAGRVTAREETVDVPRDWSPEHLVLAGLIGCSLTSLRHHAKREGVQVDGGGSASATVTRRESDGRFAFVDVELRFDLQLTPPSADLPALLAKAERDCFVAASLTTRPRYDWSVS